MIKYQEIDKLPKEAKGNLCKKQHKFSGFVHHVDDCGSHGCTGHSYYALVCSCRFVTHIGDFSSKVEQLVISQHKVNVITAQLGITFS